MATALVILLLLVSCGVIAYAGDVIGRRMGKKRLTLWGMRPRHTAVLITIVTGVLIAVTTVGVAMAMIPGFGYIVRRGEQLVADNRVLVRRRDRLKVKKGELEAELAQTRAALAKTQSRLEPLQMEHDRLLATNSELEAARAQLTKRNEGLLGKNRRLQGETGSLRIQRRDLTKQVGTLQATATAYEQGFVIAREGTPLTRPRPVLALAPRSVLARALDGLIEEARQEVKRRHLADSLNMAQPLCKLVAPPGMKAKLATEAEIRKHILDKAASFGNRNIVMRVRAARNALAGETVPILVDAYVDTPVYQKGEVVAYSLIEAGASEGVVLGDMLDLLEKVRASAARPPHPIFPDENGQVGDVSFDTLLRVSRQVRTMGGRVKVAAIATRDTRRSGPLNLEFTVEPVGASLEGE